MIDRARLTETLKGAGFDSSSDSAIRLLLVEPLFGMMPDLGFADRKVLIEVRLRRFGDHPAVFLDGAA